MDDETGGTGKISSGSSDQRREMTYPAPGRSQGSSVATLPADRALDTGQAPERFSTIGGCTAAAAYKQEPRWRSSSVRPAAVLLVALLASPSSFSAEESPVVPIRFTDITKRAG